MPASPNNDPKYSYEQNVITLASALAAWGTADFEHRFKADIKSLDSNLLPLQAGLAQSNYVSDSEINVVILNTTEMPDVICVKAGIFYAGVVVGSCCADDPTPLSEQPEYCEVQFNIDKATAQTAVTLLQ